MTIPKHTLPKRLRKENRNCLVPLHWKVETDWPGSFRSVNQLTPLAAPKKFSIPRNGKHPECLWTRWCHETQKFEQWASFCGPTLRMSSSVRRVTCTFESTLFCFKKKSFVFREQYFFDDDDTVKDYRWSETTWYIWSKKYESTIWRPLDVRELKKEKSFSKANWLFSPERHLATIV